VFKSDNTLPSLARLRRRIEVQGYKGLTDREIAEAAPWLRFTPALNALALACATLMRSVPLLLILAAIMALGAVFRRHPFDWVYGGFVRPFENSPPLPRSGGRRRLVFASGVPWLLCLAWLFHSGRDFWAMLLGFVTASMIALLAVAYICIPSELMERLSRR
jgi:hypothetical protein